MYPNTIRQNSQPLAILPDSDVSRPGSKPQPCLVGEEDVDSFVDQLRAVYRTYHLEWLEHCEAMDRLRLRLSRKKRSTMTPATASIDLSTLASSAPDPCSNPNGIIPISNSSSSLTTTAGLTTIAPNGRTTRRTANSTTFGVGDAVTDAQFDIVLAHLGTADQKDPNIRAMKTTATVPDMALLPRDRMSVLMEPVGDTLVEDPISFYELDILPQNDQTTSHQTHRLHHQSWTQEEQEAFETSYTAQPKQFGWIASQVKTKSRAECVLHYYRTKRQNKYRNLHYCPPPVVEGKPREALRGKKTRRAALKTQTLPVASTQPKPAKSRLAIEPGNEAQTDGEGDEESVGPTPVEPGPTIGINFSWTKSQPSLAPASGLSQSDTSHPNPSPARQDEPDHPPEDTSESTAQNPSKFETTTPTEDHSSSRHDPIRDSFAKADFTIKQPSRPEPESENYPRTDTVPENYSRTGPVFEMPSRTDSIPKDLSRASPVHEDLSRAEYDKETLLESNRGNENLRVVEIDQPRNPTKIYSPKRNPPLLVEENVDARAKPPTQDTGTLLAFRKPTNPLKPVEHPSISSTSTIRLNLESKSSLCTSENSKDQLSQEPGYIHYNSNVPQKRKLDFTDPSVSPNHKITRLVNRAEPPPTSLLGSENAPHTINSLHQFSSSGLTEVERNFRRSPSEVMPKVGGNERSLSGLVAQPISLGESCRENFPKKKIHLCDPSSSSASQSAEDENAVRKDISPAPLKIREDKHLPKKFISHSSMQIRNLLNDDPIEPSKTLSKMDTDSWFGSNNESKDIRAMHKTEEVHQFYPQGSQHLPAPKHDVQVISEEYPPRATSFQPPVAASNSLRPPSHARPRLFPEIGLQYSQTPVSDTIGVDERFADPPSPPLPHLSENQRYHYVTRLHLEPILTTDQASFSYSSQASNATLPPHFKPSRTYASSQEQPAVATEYYGNPKITSSSQAKMPIQFSSSPSPRLASSSVNPTPILQHHNFPGPRPDRLAPLMSLQNPTHSENAYNHPHQHHYSLHHHNSWQGQPGGLPGGPAGYNYSSESQWNSVPSRREGDNRMMGSERYTSSNSTSSNVIRRVNNTNNNLKE
ncbi:expressed protein [Phakopsora pachyrhizi]|uniref:Expressed protein n=1 Tax=Phakopsora pachyrhizi TaxID=170000 RepID=A0AAV0BTL8_PHAPC|nr:expressed protein [Phakopsora pachyrhizi]